MITRRKFIEKSSLAGMASLFAGFLKFPEPGFETGLALYTLREELSIDLDGTLESVRRIGFINVEAANYSDGMFYGLKPLEFRTRLANHGLKLKSCHCRFDKESAGRAVDDVSETGAPYLVLPSLNADLRKEINAYETAAALLNEAGALCRKSGLKLAYHNHTYEFKPLKGRVPYDVLLSSTEPELVTFEPDICWMKAAGEDPLTWLVKYRGRFELMHLKDMTRNKRDTTLGEGIIDFSPLLGYAAAENVKFAFVEQDNCRIHPPLECVRISRKWLDDHKLH